MSSPATIEVARGFLGTRTGDPAVAKFLAFVHLRPPNAWCLAFALFVAAPSNLPRYARCSLEWHTLRGDSDAYRTYTVADVEWGIETPKAGDICFYAHNPNPGVDNWDGHAVTVVRYLGNLRIATIEGNTSSNAKGDQRNGGVVAEKVRVMGMASGAFAFEGCVRPRA